MLQGAALAEALARVPLVELHGPWARAVAFQHLRAAPPGHPSEGPPQPLWPGSAALRGARFTPKGGFGSVYLSGDAVTALAEVEGVFLHRQLRPVLVPCRRVWMVIRVEGLLTRVLDLADPKVQALLGSSSAELMDPWLGIDRPPTQRLGQAAFESGRVVALRYGSIKHPDGYNLVVFTDRLADVAPDYLEVSEPGMAQRLP